MVERYGREVFEFLDNFIRVSIPYNIQLNKKVTDKVTDKVAHKVADNINPTQQKIIQLINSNSNITIEVIAEELKLNDSGVRKNIKILKEFGLLERVGSTKSGHWKVNI